MELRISAKNLKVSERFRDYVSEKSGKVEQFSHRPQELNIKVTRYEHSRTAGPEDQVELTVYEPGHVVRAEARAEDKFAAFDIAFGKLLERLRRYADKQKVHRGGNHRRIGTSELAATDFADLDVTPVDHNLLTGEIPIIDLQDQEQEPVNKLLIRSKEFEKVPMNREDAVGHMELVGHDFYLYHDVDSDKPAVVYRRHGYSYGVITLS